MRPSSKPARRRRRRGRDGFTLLELMVIVVIVMILTAMLAPSAVRVLAIFRAQQASLEVLRMARLARREAMEGGRAIVVRVGAGGHLEVRRGTSNLCRTSAWSSQFADACASPNDLTVSGTSCVGFVDPAMFGVGFHEVEFAPIGTAMDVCYQPNGEALFGTGGTFLRQTGIDAIRIAINRTENNVPVDPIRTILMPADSSPRAVR